MDNKENIFHLEVDQTAKNHMLEVGRWGKFLAIIGFICLGLVLLAGVFGGAVLSNLAAASGQTTLSESIVGPVLLVECIIIAGIMFYPVYALLKFSNLIKPALLTANQAQFNDAFRYLKGLFKYYGIMTIIFLSIYGICIIFVIIGLSMR